MINERIVCTNPNGSVGVLVPTGEISIAEVMAKDVPAGATNVREITIAELPQDRMFRSAWDDSNPENFIGTDLVKAQAIAHDMRRADRDMKMEPLDKEAGFVSTTQMRKDIILTEKTSILNTNAQIQTDINTALDESALRAVLSIANIS
jgi:hypothetical protein